MNFPRTAHIHLMLVGTLALQPLTVSAQTPPTFSVSVTETYELVEEVGTTRRLSRAEIETRNARTLDEALRLSPASTSGQAATAPRGSTCAAFDRVTSCC